MTPNVGDSHPPDRDCRASDGSVHQLPPAMLCAKELSVRIPVVVSTRHAHLTAEIIEQLFCDRYRLHPRDAMLPGQHFTTLETVDLIGPRGRLRNVPVIGPPRAMNQIEISRADALLLGIRVAVRESVDLVGSPGLTVQGPRSQVALRTGVICASRHVRMNAEQARELGLKDQDHVEVAIQGRYRSLCFQDVLVRVGEDFCLGLHLDTDDANAAGVRTGDSSVLTKRIREAPPSIE